MPSRIRRIVPATTACAVRHDETAKLSRSRELVDPEFAFERIEAKGVAHGLAQAEQARDQRQRKVEQTGSQNPLAVHCKQRRSFHNRNCGASCWRQSLAGTDMIAQCLRSFERDGVEDAFLLLASRGRASLQLDPRQAEQAMNRPLLQVDVGYPIERNGPAGAAQEPAIDADLMSANPIFEEAP